MEAVAHITWMDFNAPHAKASKHCGNLCEVAAGINNINAALNCDLMIMPDLAKASSEKGLADEEQQILDNFWALEQDMDCRWIELWNRPRGSEMKSFSKRVGWGRIGVAKQHAKNHIVLLNSELSLAGRPLGEDAVASLPRGSELLVPVSESPDADLLLAERQRPSPEQVAAQKGARRVEVLITSLFTGVKFPGPVVIDNLTGHVEDVGSAAQDLANKA